MEEERERCPFCHRNLHANKGYDNERISYVQYVYIIGIICWIGLVYILHFYQTDVVGWIILIVPFVAFIIGYINASVVTYDVEEELFQADHLSVGLLIALPLMTWISKDFPGDRRRFNQIIILAIIATMLSMIDIWVSREWLSVVKHIKSVLQTFSLVLLVYALYMYFISTHHVAEPSNYSLMPVRE